MDKLETFMDGYRQALMDVYVELGFTELRDSEIWKDAMDGYLDEDQ